ncbi:hypothetical protein Tco_0736324 [Tanacetum coccineum]
MNEQRCLNQPKSGKRRKQMARKGLHTDLDKDDSEGSDEVSEQDDSVSGTKIPINPVPVAMKSPSIATYKIIKQGEKGVYQIVREDRTDIVEAHWATLTLAVTSGREVYNGLLRKSRIIALESSQYPTYMSLRADGNKDWLFQSKRLLRMNEKGFDSSKSEALKEGSKEEVQKESKEEESTRKRKLEDLNAVYQLVMDKFQDDIPEGFDRVLWGESDGLLVLNSPCFMVKSWLVQDQTVLGKDYSNLLIADSLLKTIWFINAPCYGNEALASPKANGVCLGDDASKQGRINDIVADEDITLILKLIIKQLKM